MNYTRRDFGKLAIAAAALPAVSLQAKPNSNFNGVQIGIIVSYSYREMPDANDAMAILKHLVDDGLSACEVTSGVVEGWAGAPAAQNGGGGGRAGGAAPTYNPLNGLPGQPAAARGPLTPEQQAAAAALSKWRVSASMDKFKAFRKIYNDAGVNIYGFRMLPAMTASEEEYDYAFAAAEALGANQIGGELPTDPAHTKRLGQAAERHKMLVSYHAHLQASLTAWDQALAQSKGNAIQLDVGHYVAGTGQSPIPFMEKHHSRIASLHVKDRLNPEHGRVNQPWGQGDTPIKEILQLMKKNRYTFPAGIELEYKTPAGSDPVAEVAKCVEYCRKALA